MSDGTTHWDNCYAFGPKHYDCLLAEAARRGDQAKALRAENERLRGYWMKAQAEVNALRARDGK